MTDNVHDLDNATQEAYQAIVVSLPCKTHKYGEYGWVKLSDAQFAKLKKDLGEVELQRCIKYIDEQAQQTSNKNRWKDWNLVIRRCSREGWGKAYNKPVTRSATEAKNNYQRKYNHEDLVAMGIIDDEGNT